MEKVWWGSMAVSLTVFRIRRFASFPLLQRVRWPRLHGGLEGGVDRANLLFQVFIDGGLEVEELPERLHRRFLRGKGRALRLR